MTNQVRVPRSRAPRLAMLAAALVPGLAACGDDPFSFDWVAEPDTVVLYSMARPEIDPPSGFSFYSGSAIRVEAPGATGTWDVALDTQEGALVFLPPGALGVDSRARIAPIEAMALDDVLEAPSDTAAFVANEPVPVEMGTVYVIRTGQRTGSFGTRCVYYAKAEAVEIDAAAGILRFRYITNPVCNNRNLVPPD